MSETPKVQPTHTRKERICIAIGHFFEAMGPLLLFLSFCLTVSYACEREYKQRAALDFYCMQKCKPLVGRSLYKDLCKCGPGDQPNLTKPDHETKTKGDN